MDAHAATKLSLRSLESFCFNKDNLPIILDPICKVDCPFVPLFWMNIAAYKKIKIKISACIRSQYSTNHLRFKW